MRRRGGRGERSRDDGGERGRLSGECRAGKERNKCVCEREKRERVVQSRCACVSAGNRRGEMCAG